MSSNRGGPRPGSNTSSSSAAALNPFQKPRADWLTALAADGEAARTPTATIPKEPASLVTAIKETRQLLLTPEEHERALIESVKDALLKRGIDQAFLDAGVDLTTRYDAATKLPLETPGTEVLSPEDRAVIDQAHELFAALHKSLRDVRKNDPAGVKSLVGDPGNTETSTGARDALKKFLEAAPTRTPLLIAAGITDDDVAAAADLHTKLEAIIGRKGLRVNDRQSKAAKVEASILAMEAWIQMFRSRGRMACRGNDPAFGLITSKLPRSERRTKAHRPNGGGGGGGAGSSGQSGSGNGTPGNTTGGNTPSNP